MLTRVMKARLARFWAGPRWLRVVAFTCLGALGVVLAGKLVTFVTGFWCACWVGNLRVGLSSGAAGGALFGFIFDPHPFGPTADDEQAPVP
jgi:hypothetical protein